MVDFELAKKMVLAPLSTETSEEDIRKFAKDLEGIEVYSIIVDEYYIPLAKELLPNRRIGTIISYPLGNLTLEVNKKLIKKALDYRCSEIDYSPKFNYIKSKKYNLVREELKEIVNIVDGGLDIVALPQVAQMTMSEIEKLCSLFLEVGIHIIKTNSGLNQGITEMEHVQFIKRKFGDSLEIEVSGGVRTREQALTYLEIGASRIHSSTWKQIIGIEEEA
jgi:deoxyribose-phosphate aldolase